ncbi:hypothetical protein [Nitrobacter hamburgensis]|uniref:hypothetical protein n=1 Tax=Nitrobacter hamburgensis TaxID=912 RepID=UPI0018DBB5B7|nr:hypothetical protein [Nitrobacter hamburgensis]
MSDRIAECTERIDAKISKAVAEAIGVRLRIDVRPEETKLPVQLQLLLNQLRSQDNDT